MGFGAASTDCQRGVLSRRKCHGTLLTRARRAGQVFKAKGHPHFILSSAASLSIHALFPNMLHVAPGPALDHASGLCRLG